MAEQEALSGADAVGGYRAALSPSDSDHAAPPQQQQQQRWGRRLRAGIAEALRRNAAPAMLLQLSALACVLGFYLLADVAAALTALGRMKHERGFAFSALSTAVFGGMVPALAELARAHWRRRRRPRAHALQPALTMVAVSPAGTAAAGHGGGLASRALPVGPSVAAPAAGEPADPRPWLTVLFAGAYWAYRGVEVRRGEEAHVVPPCGAA